MAKSVLRQAHEMASKLSGLHFEPVKKRHTTLYRAERIGDKTYRIQTKSVGYVSLVFSDKAWRIFHPRLPAAGVEQANFNAGRAYAVAYAKSLGGESRD